MELTEQPPPLKIGDLAQLTGVPIKTIRYYEQRGLLEPAHRTQARYRIYSPEEAARLRFIKRAKLLGLKLQEIRELVPVVHLVAIIHGVLHLGDPLTIGTGFFLARSAGLEPATF